MNLNPRRAGLSPCSSAREAADQPRAGLETRVLDVTGAPLRQVRLRVQLRNNTRTVALETLRLSLARPDELARKITRLVEFRKVVLSPGEMVVVSLAARPLAFKRFDQERNAWILPKGEYRLMLSREHLGVVYLTSFVLD